MAQVHKFSCLKLKNCNVAEGVKLESFSVRETDGRDEEYAAQRAKAKGGVTTTTEELIRASISEVNGLPVTQPYEAMDSWNSRARGFLIAAWRNVNAVDDTEVQDFLLAASIGPS